MLGAVSMREPWASMRIMRWRLHMKLRAFCCPPARDVSLRVAHLHATASQVRFRTMAVAPACRNTPQQSGCVRKERERTGQENDSLQVESEQGTPPRDGFVDEAAHQSILRKEQEKPIVRESGSHVTRVLEPAGEGRTKSMERGGSRFRLEAVLNWTRSTDLGPVGRITCECKLKIISHLPDFLANSTLAGAVHERAAWARFQMTGCEKWQARGKGLACHCLQIVPTCL